MSHMCGTIVVRATSNRSPRRPPFHFTSARSGMYMTAFGERVRSTSARSPAKASDRTDRKMADRRNFFMAGGLKSGRGQKSLAHGVPPALGETGDLRAVEFGAIGDFGPGLGLQRLQ